ncbi:glutaminyl-peptide cyclotransferase [Luteibacter rhizovicinus]|uniref:Glutaminyl-peptide cyclotransferase n=1 Tax=Luteibacter rhizovicinus TaxID=242606 RepID=A0A4R3YLG1_9GAMM|nr:glutaminyl-peptide cyclotransferase [Luteibacter rhizovicinus]TCV91643.1 glutaminyl-peptide cyclotransferase [Luteibacter rhizovicinus]
MHRASAFQWLALALGTALTVQSDVALGSGLPVYGYKVVHSYPHDPKAFTEGLFYDNGYLYESTGEPNTSSVRKVDLESGEVLQRVATPKGYFGEGIIAWGPKLIQLSWQEGVGFIMDKTTFAPTGRFSYPGEGWAMTRDATHIYMSDGTPRIRILDPETLKAVGTIDVTADGVPVWKVNELEWVKGEIYANIWQTDRIARIDPKTGHVLGWIDLKGLLGTTQVNDPVNDVLNGIAYDAAHDRLFVTGKRWPRLFEIRLTR